MNVGFQIPNEVKCCTYVAPKIIKALRKSILKPLFIGSEWRDLNPRPLAPQASALPGCATPRFPKFWECECTNSGENKKIEFPIN